jgi:glycerate dehydrogenase
LQQNTIVVLDGGALNPGDLSWEPLQALGTVSVYPRSTREQVVERASEANLVLLNKAIMDREIIQSLPRLRYIGVLATGYNSVDVVAARERGIVVSNVPSYGTACVAQSTIALLLALTNHVHEHGEIARSGRWSASGDWCVWDRPIVELSGKVMGIIGMGRIGQAVARIATALGLNVIGSRGEGKPGSVPLRQLLAGSDVVSLHCPLTPQTTKLVNPETLATMKKGAILINTARGGLIDEAALARALHSNHLGGAGLDVLSTEPPEPDHPLLRVKNCIVTPHCAWTSVESRRRLLNQAIENLSNFLLGRPSHQVN